MNDKPCSIPILYTGNSSRSIMTSDVQQRLSVDYEMRAIGEKLAEESNEQY